MRTDKRFETPSFGLDKPHRYIYFVQALTEPYLVKIGRSANFGKRFEQLVNGSPVPLKVIGLLVSHANVEPLIHSIFESDRQHGEWFALSDRLVGFIARHKSGEWATLEYLAEGLIEAGATDDHVEKLMVMYKQLRLVSYEHGDDHIW